jgi:hypothetical protein
VKVACIDQREVSSIGGRDGVPTASCASSRDGTAGRADARRGADVARLGYWQRSSPLRTLHAHLTTTLISNQPSATSRKDREQWLLRT